MSDDRNNFDWHTIEFDLGDLSQAPQIKLIIDAETVAPTSNAGIERINQLAINGKRTEIQVLDANGNWTVVPKATKELPAPKEFGNSYIVDISNIFLTNNYKVRIRFLCKTYIDAIYFDTTADEAVSVAEIPFASANLAYYGFSKKSFSDELYEFIYGNKEDKLLFYMPGNYTRYGDVTPLLTLNDDKFVIFGGGDEVVVKFHSAASGPAGTSRRFLLQANGYYKDNSNLNIDRTVEPLPFAGMSNFPYDTAVENYPSDSDHNQYRADYNTRIQ